MHSNIHEYEYDYKQGFVKEVTQIRKSKEDVLSNIPARLKNAWIFLSKEVAYSGNFYMLWTAR